MENIPCIRCKAEFEPIGRARLCTKCKAMDVRNVKRAKGERGRYSKKAKSCIACGAETFGNAMRKYCDDCRVARSRHAQKIIMQVKRNAGRS